MPYIVQEIIEENPDLVTAKADEPVHDALVRMVANDFSQLPIVDEDKKPDGMITSESILKAVSNLNVGLDQLFVSDAWTKAESVRDDSDLFEVLNRLEETYAVLVVDGEECLKGIVTNYDSARYFRRRAEDMMHVQDIETLIKDYIQAAYKDDEDEVDEGKLAQAIQRITSSGKDQQETFEKALRHYLTLQKGSGIKAKPDQEYLEEVLNKHYKIERSPKQFEHLTLNEYITLLLHEDRWEHYRHVFNKDRNKVHELFDNVRKTRNSLAHFREEITQEQSEKLRWVSDWLARRMDKLNDVFATETILQEVKIRETPPQAYYTVEEDEPDEIVPAEDEAEPGESRYAPLAIWLQNQQPRKNLVKPTFTKIEKIIGGPLPESAYKHRSWWVNDSANNVQAQQWLDVGWRMSSINMTKQVVRFSRMRDRQRAYIEFYNSLLTKLRNQPGFKNINVGPNGGNWHLIESINGLASFTLAFGRGDKFRIELYIDSGDQTLNKKLYDGLEHQRESIEQALGRKLLWQRLDKRRASRIAIVFEDARVISLPSERDDLQRRVIPATVEFRKIMLPRVQEVGKGLV